MFGIFERDEEDEECCYECLCLVTNIDWQEEVDGAGGCNGIN